MTVSFLSETMQVRMQWSKKFKENKIRLKIWHPGKKMSFKKEGKIKTPADVWKFWENSSTEPHNKKC